MLIGAENDFEAVRACSLVVSRYGDGALNGFLGVVGPARLDYARAIAAVRFLSDLMSELVAELPAYTIIKDKFTVARDRLPALNEMLVKRWPEAKVNRLDGLRLDWERSWLHVRASSSAHVVIRTKNMPGPVPQSVIKRAAVLAAQHSTAKHASIVPVDYTLKRYVRRPRGAPSGTVTYQNEKTIHVSPKGADS